MERVKQLLRAVDEPGTREINRVLEDLRRQYSEQEVKKHAREDGELDIPRQSGNGSSPYEVQMQHDAIAAAGRIVSKYKVALEVLDSLIKAEEQHNENEHQSAKAHIESLYAVEKDAAENAQTLKFAHKELETAQRRYEAMRDKYGRSPVSYIPLWFFIVLAVAIFLGEVPLNALVFQIFGENQVMTWVMALIIGLCVPVSAHFIGIKFREHGEGFSLANFLKGAIGTAIIVGALYGLSVMRTTYLGEFKDELGLTDTLVSSSFMFFWLNVAVFSAAVFISYLAHDTIPGFEQAEHEYLRAKRRVEKEERRRIARLKKAGANRADRIKVAERDFRDANNSIKILKGHYDKILKEGQEAEVQCKQLLNRQIAMYRRENLKARPKEDSGRVLEYDGEFEFPLKLLAMEEKLIN